ncbi:hypothetical protein B9Z55_018006 [Caenorhabditis nigoni]|nr:hypothetical protein B9Z55_018006 [Caenorhabditis nigoni]
MKKLITSSQMNRFQSMRFIRYRCDKTKQPYVYVHFNNNDQRLMRVASRREKIMRIVEHNETENDYFLLNVSGTMIAFRFTREGRNERIQYPEKYYNPYPVASYQPSEKESVIKPIHNYFLAFFGSSMEYQWHGMDLTGSSYYIPFIPQLQKLVFCVRMYISQDFADMENLEKIFSSSPVFKSIQMSASRTTKTFHPESKFYQAESINITQCVHTFPAILRHFKGRQVFIKSIGRETSGDLIEFVNRWKSGEAFQKLEFLKFEVLRDDLLHNGIFNEVGAKYIEATKQPPTHILPKVHNWYYQIENTDPITSHAYVVRQSDNCVASILILERTLFFGVWDKTEEDFLKMIN